MDTCHVAWWLSLLKIVETSRKPQFPRAVPHTLGRHGCDLVRSRLPPLVPRSKPSVTGARACRVATSGDRLAPATPSPTSAPFRRPVPVGLALPSAAAGPRNLGTRQTGDCRQVASQRLSDSLAMAITLDPLRLGLFSFAILSQAASVRFSLQSRRRARMTIRVVRTI